MSKIKCLVKTGVSILISIVVLSLFSLVYYNPPVAKPQPDKITNNKFFENKSWSYMLEGVGYGKTDNLGYNNSYYDNCVNPDVIFMGSSHIEALQVPGKSNVVYLLNEMFDKDGISDNDYKCLNLGVSGHSFSVSVSNFEYVIEKYSDAKYLIIETSNVEFSEKELEKMLKGEYHTDLEERNFIYTAAQEVPYFRLLFKKINEVSEKDTPDEDNTEYIESYEDKMCEILDKISVSSMEKGIKPIILYHNRIDIGGDSVKYEDDTKYLEIFKKCCEKSGVEFLDVTPRFIEEFKNTYKLPYGFSNTVPGKGHLNKFGHELIAEELYKKITGEAGV